MYPFFAFDRKARIAYASEFVGTFLLVLIGTGSVIVNEAYPNSLGNFSIALSFGLVVCFTILLFGKWSKAHINPAVSIVFVLTKDLPKNKLIGYLFFQFSGAIAASILLTLIWPISETYGATLPKIGVLETFITEALLSMILMTSIFISLNKSLKPFLPFIVGGIVFLEAYYFGSLTGASMNPARSFGPAIVEGESCVLWIYIIAPTIGMLFSYFLIKFKK